MRSTSWFGGALLSGAAAAIVAVGCGGSTASTSSSSGTGAKNGGTTSTGSASTTGPGATSTSTGSASTGSGTGGESGATSTSTSSSTSTGSSSSGGVSYELCTGTTLATAAPLTVGTAVAGVVPSPTSPCYYSFAGTAGDHYAVSALAQLLASNPQAGNPALLDTVVVVYMPDMTTILAENDDAWPVYTTDSSLFTELPTTGTYYVAIEDCNAFAAANPGKGLQCNPAKDITNRQFQLGVENLTMTAGSQTLGSDSTPSTITYTVPSGNTAGEYGSVLLAGDLTSSSAVQTFNFTPPKATATVAGSRLRAYFWAQPTGAFNGDGSTANVLLTVKDPKGNVLAQADQSNFGNGDTPPNGPLQLSFPLDDQFGNGLGTEYTLSVAVSPSATLTSPLEWYYLIHDEGALNAGTEDEEGPTGSGKNDTPATAQAVSAITGEAGYYAIDGNLSSTTDVDWYSFVVAAKSTIVGLSCSAGRDGSGLLGFTATLYPDDTGTSTPIATLGPEASPPTQDLYNGDNGSTLASTVKTVYLKISATGQSPTVAGTFYSCNLETVDGG